MRWHIIRTLLVKEALRHLADRGAIFLAALLVATTLLLSIFGKDETAGGGFLGGVQLYYVDYWEDSSWIQHLRSHKPKDLKLEFRPVDSLPKDETGKIVYRMNTAAVQIRPNGPNANGRPRFHIMFWHPGNDRSVVEPLAQWFWKETLNHFQGTPIDIETEQDRLAFPDEERTIYIRRLEKSAEGKSRHRFSVSGSENSPPDPQVEIVEESLKLQGGGPEVTLLGMRVERARVTSVLVVFGLFLFCVYLLPSFSCEERERGVLLAQALSPASPWEILGAKFLFYPGMGISLAALLTGIFSPAILLRPYFWVVLLASTLGYLGVGLTIASLARTQRMASMGALCYLLTFSLLLFVTERFGIPSIRFVALEYYIPKIIYSVFQKQLLLDDWLNLVAAILLGFFWAFLATTLFRQRGWQ